MARKTRDPDNPPPRKRKRNTPTKVEFGDYVFAEIRLTSDEEADCSKWLATDPSLLEALTDLTGHGHKISFSTMNDGTTHICSFTVTDPGLPDAGCVVTAFAENASDALLVLYYKLTVLVGDFPIAEIAHNRKKKRPTIG